MSEQIIKNLPKVQKVLNESWAYNLVTLANDEGWRCELKGIRTKKEILDRYIEGKTSLYLISYTIFKGWDKQVIIYIDENKKIKIHARGSYTSGDYGKNTMYPLSCNIKVKENWKFCTQGKAIKFETIIPNIKKMIPIMNKDIKREVEDVRAS